MSALYIVHLNEVLRQKYHETHEELAIHPSHTDKVTNELTQKDGCRIANKEDEIYKE